jgi:hypothetical protein
LPPGGRGKYAHVNTRLIDAMPEVGGLAMLMPYYNAESPEMERRANHPNEL